MTLELLRDFIKKYGALSMWDYDGLTYLKSYHRRNPDHPIQITNRKWYNEDIKSLSTYEKCVSCSILMGDITNDLYHKVIVYDGDMVNGLPKDVRGEYLFILTEIPPYSRYHLDRRLKTLAREIIEEEDRKALEARRQVVLNNLNKELGL